MTFDNFILILEAAQKLVHIWAPYLILLAAAYVGANLFTDLKEKS